MIADSARPERRDLARRIREGLQRQVDQMPAWRARWYPDAAAPSTDTNLMGAMMDGGGMTGIPGGSTMRGMMGGDPFSERFCRHQPRH